MKTVDAALAEIQKHLTAGWHLDIGGAGDGRWPKVVSLGTISSSDADRRYTEVMAWSHAWHDWVRDRGCQLRVITRRIRGIDYSNFPTHLVINSPDHAARAVGNGWPARLALSQERAERIAAGFPQANLPQALRLSDALDDTDFNLALTAARWFAANAGLWPGLTARQVPVAGLHAKWLDTHKPLVKVLLGRNDLTLVERGTRVYWTYLDPEYRRTGGRTHDSLTIGDNVPLPYQPRVVLVVENKDTAILFPALPSAIAVEGNGNASVGLLPQVPWIVGAETIVYWGDIDARGYEIVNGLRERLPLVQTILMDSATFEEFEQFGTNLDERGAILKPRKRLPLPYLTEAERVLYLNVTDPDWPRNRRLEQERIPLARALSASLAIANHAS